MTITVNTAINRSISEKNDEYYVYAAKSRLVSGGFVTEQKAFLQHSRYSAIPQLHNSTIAQFSNVYDHLDRRVQKITPEATHSFFYDGWMLVKEVIASANGTTTIVEYHWGNDLSGTRGGAAGVGGLLYLSVSNSNSQPQLYFPWYDNNGNIMGYWDERGKVVASFDYSAFGETTAYGDNPDAFPIRFSTKYHDPESDLYYYTKRFYHPSLHRWLTRDPIEEEGGANLYSMCGNNTISNCDAIGKKWIVRRKSNKRWAKAKKTSASDSVEDLARSIKLDPRESNKWLRPIRHKKCTFEIPNVFVAYTSAPKWGDGQLDKPILAEGAIK